jgi:hypothetical protein
MTQRPSERRSLRGSIVTTRLIGLLTGNSPLMTLVSNYASSIQLSRGASETTLEATLSPNADRCPHSTRQQAERARPDRRNGCGCARKRATASEHGAEGGEAVGGWWLSEAWLRYGREVADPLRYSDHPSTTLHARSEPGIGTPDRERPQNRTSVPRVDHTRKHRGQDTTRLRTISTTGPGAIRHDVLRFTHSDTRSFHPRE